MPWLRDSWSWIKDRKIGIGFGALVGAGIYLYFSGQGSPLFAIEAPSAIDKIVTVATKWKYLISLMIVGATVGAFVDRRK